MTDMSAPAIDVSALMERLEGDQVLLAELVGLYLEDEPGLLTQIDAAIARRDPEALRRAAHALKGSVGNFCAPGAHAAALALETAGHDGAIGDAPVLLTHLTRELVRVREALQTLVSRP